MRLVWKRLLKAFPSMSHHYSHFLSSFAYLSAPLSLYLNLSLCLHLLMFFFLLPLDQCPLCHQEMYKPRLSTPLLCALPGLPRARSLSMESTRDIRWAAPFCKLVHSGGQEGHCCYSIQALSVRFFFLTHLINPKKIFGTQNVHNNISCYSISSFWPGNQVGPTKSLWLQCAPTFRTAFTLAI